jgi:hypothetical protein
MGTRTKKAENWWSQTGSNRRPPACHAGALPAELWPHERAQILGDRLPEVKLAGTGGFEHRVGRSQAVLIPEKMTDDR